MKRIALLFLTLPVAAIGAEKRIELPVEKATFKPGKGADLATSYCYTCHSVEYITTQPPLPRKFWEGAVIKMKEKFGAPIPEASIQDLTDYLTEAYGKKSL